jgi:hypothetical protein
MEHSGYFKGPHQSFKTFAGEGVRTLIALQAGQWSFGLLSSGVISILTDRNSLIGLSSYKATLCYVGLSILDD